MAFHLHLIEAHRGNVPAAAPIDQNNNRTCNAAPRLRMVWHAAGDGQLTAEWLVDPPHGPSRQFEQAPTAPMLPNRPEGGLTCF